MWRTRRVDGDGASAVHDQHAEPGAQRGRAIRRRLQDAGQEARRVALNVKPTLGFTLPCAGAAAPAPAVRRRENLRSASFRDYAMAGVTPAPSTKAARRWRARPDRK